MADHEITHDAEDELDRRLSPEHPRRYAENDEPTDDAATLQREQFREADEMASGPALPVMTGPMRRGMVGGGLIGGLIGALIAAPFAFLPVMSQSLLVKLIVLVAVGFAAGATAGASYFGGRVPELSGESVDADNQPSAGSSLRDPRTDDRGR